MFLTPAELERLTGYRRRAEQRRQLEAWGIAPFVSALGQISVTWDAVEAAQRRRSGLEAERERRTRPNLRAVS